jgi:hypothetical protein
MHITFDSTHLEIKNVLSQVHRFHVVHAIFDTLMLTCEKKSTMLLADGDKKLIKLTQWCHGFEILMICSRNKKEIRSNRESEK